jgi:hypothetical protein
MREHSRLQASRGHTSGGHPPPLVRADNGKIHPFDHTSASKYCRPRQRHLHLHGQGAMQPMREGGGGQPDGHEVLALDHDLLVDRLREVRLRGEDRRAREEGGELRTDSPPGPAPRRDATRPVRLRPGAGGIRRSAGEREGQRRATLAFPTVLPFLRCRDGKSQDELRRRERLNQTEHDQEVGHHDRCDGHETLGRQPSGDESRSIEHPVVHEATEAKGQHRHLAQRITGCHHERGGGQIGR